MTTQQDVSVGISVPETTYGVAVAPTTFFEFTDEAFELKRTDAQGEGLRVSAALGRVARRATTQFDVSGSLGVELFSKGLGKLFAAVTGTGTSTLVSGTAYQQLFTLTNTDFLPSYTIQKGIPPLGGGATLPHTFDGCVASTLEIDAPNGALCTLKTEWLGRKLTTSGSAPYTYAAPSYPASGELLTFVGATATIGTAGVTVPTTTTLGTVTTPLAVANVTDFNLKIDNQLDGAGWRFGGGGYRTRPPAVGLRQVTGTITVEFDSAVWRDLWLNQNNVSMVINLTGLTTISSGVYPALHLCIPTCRLEGDIPNANKGDVISQTINFTVLDGQVAAAPLYLAYVTSDTAI